MKWEEACAIFDIKTDASEQEIKDTYIYLVKRNHPDTVDSDTEKIRKTAEKKFIRIQQAYEILKNQNNRPKQGANQKTKTESDQQAHTGSSQRPRAESSDPPKSEKESLEVFPSRLFFVFKEPGTAQHGEFEIRYRGSNPQPNIAIKDELLMNVKITGIHPLTATDCIAAKVDIEATANDCGYIEYITIHANNKTAEVQVEQQAKQAEKRYQQNTNNASNTAYTNTSSNSSIANDINGYHIGFAAAAFFLGIGLGYYFNVAFLSIVSTLIIWVVEGICLYYFWQNKRARAILLLLLWVPICSTVAILNPGFIAFQWYPAIRMMATRISSALGGAIICSVLTYLIIAKPLSNSKYKAIVLLISFLVAIGVMVLGIKFAT